MQITSLSKARLARAHRALRQMWLDLDSRFGSNWDRRDLPMFVQRDLSDAERARAAATKQCTESEVGQVIEEHTAERALYHSYFSEQMARNGDLRSPGET